MAKSKNKKRVPSSSGAPKASKATAPRDRGLEFFRQRNYLEAVRQWETLPLENDAALADALAEAHFRRALDAQGHPVAIEALRAALQLRPDESRLLYHLALALHRDNQLAEAEQIYARLMPTDARPPVQHARALAALEADATLDLTSLPWLSDEIRATLEPVAQLLRGEPLSGAAEESDDSWRPLWRGLSALQQNDDEAARTLLARGKERPLPAQAELRRAFYHGVAAARLDKSVAALDNWDEAANIARKAKIEPLPQLEDAISSVQSGRLPELYQSGQWDALLREARVARQNTPDAAQPRIALAIALHRLGLDAAREEKWTLAAQHWGELRALTEEHPELGPLPPLTHNLALAQENTENLRPSVELWEELIKATARRGRRKNPSEEELHQQARQEAERAWMRRHVLQLLQQLGDPASAIEHYKKAIKATPDDLQLRYEMAEALFANEQPAAAINETERILKLDPKRIDALLLQATIAHSESPWMTIGILQRALEIDPEHAAARQGLGKLLVEEGMRCYNYGNLKGAHEHYLEALELVPDDTGALTFLAETEIRLGKKKQAEERIEAVMRRGKLTDYGMIFGLWARQENIERAREVFARVIAEGNTSSEVYATFGSLCFLMADGKEWGKWGHELFEKAIEIAPDPAETLESIVDMLMESRESETALIYILRLVALVPDNPELLLQLAVIQSVNQQQDAALKTLKDAEKLARQFRDRDLQNRLSALRQQIQNPTFGAFGGILNDLDFG